MSDGGGVFVGLGANLGDRAETIARAVQSLAASGRVEVLKVSNLYRTAPWKVLGQPQFLNAVAEIATDLTPVALVERLLDIEHALGRDRTEGTRWAARTIDLDLLLYRDEVVHDPGCRVPHPLLHEREFALRPLLEIAPAVVIPGRGAAADWLARLDESSEVAVA